VYKKVRLEQTIKHQMGSKGLALLFFEPRRYISIGHQSHVPAVLTPGKRDGSYYTGG